MEASHGIRKLVEQKDRQIVSPDKRAQKVWEFIRAEKPEWTDWDLLCFCVEFIGYMSAKWPWLNPDAKTLAAIVYQAHYMQNDNEQLRSGIVSEFKLIEESGIPRFVSESG